MKKYNPLWFAALIFLSSCEKGEWDVFAPNSIYPPPPITLSTVDFLPAAQILFYIPAGRYYIFRDSASGRLDSIAVTQCRIDYTLHAATATAPAWQAAQYKNNMEIMSNGTSQPWLNVTAICDYTPYPSLGYYFDSTVTVISEPGGLPVFWYPLKNSGRNTYKFYPVLTIGGTARQQVHEFATDNGLPPADPNYESSVYYWAPDIGIVKRTIKTPSQVRTAELIRFQ